ncbi:glycosyltransferase [Candidatus Peregrinibacteria bacterium]|jgi:glycosyltransferase involved in cell wall biosynthesis|nr:glycosyltransferase [Candidatus Peregrinibacteria bacterium]
MKRVLLVGNAPLPDDNVKKRPSEGLRTWQFVKALTGGMTNGSAAGSTSGSMAGSSAGEDGSRNGRVLSKMVPRSGLDLRLVTIAVDDCYDDEDLEPEVGTQASLGFADGGSDGAAGSGAGADAKVTRESLLRKDYKYGANFIHHQISENDSSLYGTLQSIIDEHKPDVIIGVNLDVCNVLSRMRFDCVFWADMAGWTMAKAQIDAYKTRNDRRLGSYLRLEENVLARADFISVVSEAQKYTVVGELAMMKKMGAYEFDREFVVTIENGLEDFKSDRIEKIVRTVRNSPSADRAWSAGGLEEVEDSGLRYFRGPSSYSGADIPSNAFVILWLGSYSAWVDEETLFKGVEAAMAAVAGADEGSESGAGGGGGGGSSARRGSGLNRTREIYFVSTGGLSELSKSEASVSEGANKTYLNFKEMVGLSRFKDQFKFLGWVPAKHIPYLYREADIGINVDRRCLDTLTGSRNRLLEMMKFELPIVSTFGTELSYGMGSFGACLGVASGSIEGVRDAILELYSNPARRKDYGSKGRKYLESYCAYDRVMKPFNKWLGKFSIGAGVADDGLGRGGSGAARGSVARGSAAIGDRAHKFLVKFGLK